MHVGVLLHETVCNHWDGDSRGGSAVQDALQPHASAIY